MLRVVASTSKAGAASGSATNSSGAGQVTLVAEAQGLTYRRIGTEGVGTVSEPTVRELRLVVTADDYDAALCFYRDVLGLTDRQRSPPRTGCDDSRGRPGDHRVGRSWPRGLH